MASVGITHDAAFIIAKKIVDPHTFSRFGEEVVAIIAPVTARVDLAATVELSVH